MDPKHPAVYILASKRQGTLYIGVTSHLIQRIFQHREHAVKGFTSEYDVDRLVYFELHGSMEAAIQREKQLKKWNRAWKIRLIEEGNPEWRNLWERFWGVPLALTGAGVDSRLRGNDGGGWIPAPACAGAGSARE